MMGKKIVLLTGITAVAAVAYIQLGDRLSLQSMANQEAALRGFQTHYPVLVYGLAFGIYVLITALSLPVATALSLAYGWYFGFTKGLVLVSFASTSGATLAFLISRFLMRDVIQERFGERLRNFNHALEREGPFFLFTLRLIPAIPFFVINAVMGLTPIRTWTFWWVSQIGMLAGTIVYIYAGSSVPNLQTLAEQGINAVFSPKQITQILIAFSLLGIFPLLVRYGMRLVIRGRTRSDSIPSPQIKGKNG